jgi:hypothetical protein
MNFVGSFRPGAQQPSSLTGGQFLRFRQDTFINEVQFYSNIQRAERILSQLCPDSKWQLDHIHSIIVNVQAKLPENHHFLQTYQLQTARNARHFRRQVTFYL